MIGSVDWLHGQLLDTSESLGKQQPTTTTPLSSLGEFGLLSSSVEDTSTIHWTEFKSHASDILKLLENISTDQKAAPPLYLRINRQHQSVWRSELLLHTFGLFLWKEYWTSRHPESSQKSSRSSIGTILMAYVSFDVSAVISFLLLPTREAHSFLQSFDVLSCFVSSRSTLFTATSSPMKQ